MRHEDAAATAYGDASDERTDATITLYRGDEEGWAGPPVWWAEQRRAICRAMREAHDAGLMLFDELEPLRERATVQEILAVRRALSTSPA